jgi:hypothetical protein
MNLKVTALIVTMGVILNSGCNYDNGGQKKTDNGVLQKTDSAAISNSIPQEKTLLIAPYKVPCYGSFPQFCMLVKYNEYDDFRYFYDNIEGFNYSWGHEYQLSVNEYEIENPPQDGPSVSTQLVSIISQVGVDSDTTYQLTVDLGAGYIESSESGLRLVGEKDIACETPDDCAQISDLLGSDASVEINIQISEEPSNTLTLTNWTLF